MTATDINMIFEWIMMVLGTGVLVPNVLRWFWWRFNGIGFAVGTLCGVFAGILVPVLFPDVEPHMTFLILLAISSASSVAATLASSPTESHVLDAFYDRIHPAGAWGPVRRRNANPPRKGEGFGWDLLSAAITAIGLQALYLMSTYAVTHQWTAFANAALTVVGCGILLYFTWFKKLPS